MSGCSTRYIAEKYLCHNIHRELVGKISPELSFWAKDGLHTIIITERINKTNFPNTHEILCSRPKMPSAYSKYVQTIFFGNFSITRQYLPNCHWRNSPIIKNWAFARHKKRQGVKSTHPPWRVGLTVLRNTHIGNTHSLSVGH